MRRPRRRRKRCISKRSRRRISWCCAFKLVLTAAAPICGLEVNGVTIKPIDILQGSLMEETGPNGETSWAAATRENTSRCFDICSRESRCHGFTFHEAEERCYFSRSVTCSLVALSRSDCFQKPPIERFEPEEFGNFWHHVVAVWEEGGPRTIHIDGIARRAERTTNGQSNISDGEDESFGSRLGC